MYTRFIRWASDRLGDEGIVAFITNRSFIDAYMADGFRRVMADEFAFGFIVDLGGDYKKKGDAGSGNVFGIGTGVAIAFWVRLKDHKGAMKLSYISAPSGSGEDKLSWLNGIRADELAWKAIPIRTDASWVNVPDSETTGFLPLIDRATKAEAGRDRAIFKSYSLGVNTARDEWLYDADPEFLISKTKKLAKTYEEVRFGSLDYDPSIKWSRNLKRRLSQNKKEAWSKNRITTAMYRPFTSRYFYQSALFVDEMGGADLFFPVNSINKAICFTDPTAQKPFLTCGINGTVDLHFVGAAALSVYASRYRYTKSGERIDNITDWALNKFVAEYGKKGVTKDAIFHYTYAVLHDPIYRETYALNLKREFPRIPFYPDFARWASWGETLMAMHIGYEDVTPWPVERIETPAKRAKGTHPKPILKSQPEQGVVVIDADTQITGIPPEAWTYRLGNRSAIDWVLDQHKEKKPRDPTIAAKFNTYRFADYKESMIALLAKVVRVSVDSVAITEAMKALPRIGDASE